GALLPRRYGVQLGEVPEIVQCGQSLVETAIASEHVPDAPAYLTGLRHHVMPEYGHPAAGRQQQCDQYLDGRGLAGTVRPEQTETVPPPRHEACGSAPLRGRFGRRAAAPAPRETTASGLRPR